MTGIEQQQLLDAARKGEQAALGELLGQFRPYLRMLVSAGLNRQAQARQDDSDVIQDTMLVAHQAFAQFRGATVAEFAGWLRTVTLRSVANANRSHIATGKRSISREQVLEDLDGMAMRGPTGPDEQLERHEQAARVAAALERLPEDTRQVLRGRVFDGLSYAELAARMQKSEGALRVLYTRALRRLAEDMQSTDPA